MSTILAVHDVDHNRIWAGHGVEGDALRIGSTLRAVPAIIHSTAVETACRLRYFTHSTWYYFDEANLMLVVDAVKHGMPKAVVPWLHETLTELSLSSGENFNWT